MVRVSSSALADGRKVSVVVMPSLGVVVIPLNVVVVQLVLALFPVPVVLV